MALVRACFAMQHQEGKVATPRNTKTSNDNTKTKLAHTFFCAVCGRSFRTAVHLRVHGRTHTRDKDKDKEQHPKHSQQQVQESKTSTTTTTTNSIPEQLCIICCDRQPDVVLEPCQHSELCWVCASQLATCPLCRANIFSIGYSQSPDQPSALVSQQMQQQMLEQKDQPPRPPGLTGNDNEDKRAMAVWLAAAQQWHERQNTTTERNETKTAEINSLYSEMELWTKETSEWYEATSKWQAELNEWWESSVADTHRQEQQQEEHQQWYRMWDQHEQSYYFWHEGSGETSWVEPLNYIDYVHQETTMTSASPSMGAAMVACIVLQTAIRKYLSKRRHERLQRKKSRSFQKVLAMGKMKG